MNAVCPKNRLVSPAQVAELAARTCPAENYRGRRVLLIVPDGTRTAPVGLLFKALHRPAGADPVSHGAAAGVTPRWRA